LAAAPSAEEVEHALEVLQRYAGESGSDLSAIERAVPESRSAGRATRRSGEARLPGSPKDGERSILTGPAAIRGEMPDPAGETYGLVGVSNSPDGAGIGAANTAGGADVVLDGSAQGVADAELSESGIDRSSASAQTFDIANSGAGNMTLRVDGVEVVTTLTDQDTLGELSCASGELAKWNGSTWACASDDDTAPRQPGNQLSLSGNTLNVIEGSGSGLNADALDGFDSSAFSSAAHLHDSRYFTESELSTSGAGGAVHWDNLTAVPPGFADGIDDDTTYSFGPGLSVDNGQIVIDPSAFSTRITTLDSAEDVGQYSAVAIGADGLGLISYYDQTNGNLKVAHCDDVACTSATVSVLVNMAGVGSHTSVAIGTDGLGLISYFDWFNDKLKAAHCINTTCTSASTNTLDTTGDTGRFTSVAIGTDGLGLISYYDITNGDLKVAHCNNTTCSGATLTSLDLWGNVGEHTSVAIGADGLGLISYFDVTGRNLKVAHCHNVSCTGATLSVLDSGNVGQHTSLAIGSDGLGLISYFDALHTSLKVAHCEDVTCTTATLSTLDDSGHVGEYTSVAIGTDGLGLISYYDRTTSSLKVAHCNNLTCTNATINTVDTGPDGGLFTSTAIGTDGRALVSYWDDASDDLRVAHLPIGY
jgi:preprotein translocase subunit Sec61beta